MKRKNHIKVVSRDKFKKIVESGRIPENSAIISIHEPRNKVISGYAEAWPSILPDSDFVLNLWFNDVDEQDEYCEYVLFDEQMANSVMEFVEKNKDAEYWITHCTMGICRSGAVGEFLASYFNIDWFDFKKENPQIHPNTLVRKLLTQELHKKFGS